ncbi:larval cuticle protein 1-like [Toxorhynchites rutilus septentrionalis]|uniref:larval cuticle protein 1-like n=1 Tax=Toxorhynchites rutilus septentrionalis TaxID=329112 RepID=UPI00247A0387|nr:larval cuticle protein 1-like [Toxorhynchites rutilus septentrionalis]
MKLCAVLLAIACVAMVCAAPQQRPEEPVPILSQNVDRSPDGSFRFDFESGNGIKVEDQGDIRVLQVQREDGKGTEEAVVSVQRGSYSYTAPDGTPITVHWTADENGFHAEGDHLPVGP